MAFETYDDILERQFLLFQSLHLDLIGKVLLDQLFNPGIQRTMSSSEFAQFTFDPRGFR